MHATCHSVHVSQQATTVEYVDLLLSTLNKLMLVGLWWCGGEGILPRKI